MASPCLSKAQLALPGLGFKAASWRQIRSHQLPFVTRWLDWQASLTSTWRSGPTLPSPALQPLLAWPPASPKILANWGILFRTLEALMVLRRELPAALPSPGQPPTQALQRDQSRT